MRIGLFTDTYLPDINGVATAVDTLARELRQLGHEVFVVTTNLAGHSRIEREGNLIRIPGIVLKSLYSYRVSSPISPRNFDVLKDVPLDLIHIHTEYGIGYFGRILAWIRDIPLVYTYHSMYKDFTYLISHGNRVVDAAVGKFFSVFSRRWAEAPAEFTTPSEKTAKALRSYGIERYISVIPNGVDLSEYAPTPEIIEQAEKIKKGLGLEGKTILSVVGRVGQEKGIDFLLECLRRYIDETGDENVRILIVGDGPYLTQVHERVKDLWLENYAVFAGRVPHDHIPAYYALSTALLTGSKSETQGLTVNEAMAARCPVLARHDASFQAVEDGVTGFFFSDADTFTSRLTRLLHMDAKERERMLDTAQERNRERFSPARFAEEMLKVYARAIRKYW